MALFNIHGDPRQLTGTNKAGNPVNRYHESCHRCGGTGIYRWHTSFGPAAGTCFNCGGDGRGAEVLERLYTADELVKAQAARAKRQAKANEKRDAKARAEFERSEAIRLKAYALADQVGTQAAIDQLQAGLPFEQCEPDVRWQLFVLFGRAKEERAARWEAERVRKIEESQHIGQVGDRIELTLKVVHTVSFQVSRYPLIVTSVNICETPEGQSVVYKGANCWAKGSTIRVKATVKEHGEREGRKQTIIQRPKVLEVIEEVTA